MRAQRKFAVKAEAASEGVDVDAVVKDLTEKVRASPH